MVLNIRQKEIEALVRLLHFNHAPATALKAEDEVYKVLVLDQYTKDILAPLLRVNDLRKHGITLHLILENDRQPIPDVPAVYFVRATEESVLRIADDAARGLYDSMHLNFTPALPRALMERLAAATVSSNSAQRISKVFDQYLSFVSLESGLFSLGMPTSYLELNDPAAQDTHIEAAVTSVVDGLFSALVTMGVVPIIRCPKGGAAQHVATQLEAKLRDHLKARNNLFNESSRGLATSLTRPLLCLFDRNFELSVVLQHAWTYKPLAHDVLGMRLNRITVATPAAKPGQAPLSGANAQPKSFEVGDEDFFWEANGRSQFPKMAEDVDAQLQKYKAAVEELNRKTGANVDPNMDPNELMQQNTRGLMAAVSSLPELTERKRTIDKHTNLATALLGAIQSRHLNEFYNAEEDMLVGKADLSSLQLLLKGSHGTANDKLRVALVYLLTCESLPSETEFQLIETSLRDAGAHMEALAYVRRMRRMNLTGKSASAHMAPAASVGDGISAAWGLNWADKTFGQGLSSLTKGVKNLLAGEQQAAVTVAVESLMDNKPETEATFATLDPKAPPGKQARAAGPSREAIVFMIGGGNYLEYESLVTWASRAQPAKSIVYGATDLLTGEAFVEQLAELGRRSGA